MILIVGIDSYIFEIDIAFVDMICDITVLAEKLSSSHSEVFDGAISECHHPFCRVTVEADYITIVVSVGRATDIEISAAASYMNVFGSNSTLTVIIKDI